jgi:hypothetical protein
MAKGDRIINLALIEELDEEDTDAVRAALVYILLNNTEMESDEIYSLVFQDGKRITWH